jgi:hypothetical protein
MSLPGWLALEWLALERLPVEELEPRLPLTATVISSLRARSRCASAGRSISDFFAIFLWRAIADSSGRPRAGLSYRRDFCGSLAEFRASRRSRRGLWRPHSAPVAERRSCALRAAQMTRTGNMPKPSRSGSMRANTPRAEVAGIARPVRPCSGGECQAPV